MTQKDLSIVPITQDNMHILSNLAQSYEAEFSSLTGKHPNEDGVFVLDTLPLFPHVGYLLYKDNIPIGFIVADVNSPVKDVAEFYIAPIFRKNGFGKILAHHVFNKHLGQWQVRQIEGATEAIKFWRKVISSFTNAEFVEEVASDPHWGVVTKQSFTSFSK